MKIQSDLVKYFFHLDQHYSLLDAKSIRLLTEFFNMLDVHDCGALNDIQFIEFMKGVTDLTTDDIYTVFDMLDVDGSGEIEMDEFYLIFTILVATKDNEEKQFIYRHSRTVFDLLDEDGSNAISGEEFAMFGFLFNFQSTAIKKIFNEYDVSGDQELDYKEFRMFAMACIDMQNEKGKRKPIPPAKNFKHGLVLKFPTDPDYEKEEDEDHNLRQFFIDNNPFSSCVIL